MNRVGAILAMAAWGSIHVLPRGDDITRSRHRPQADPAFPVWEDFTPSGKPWRARPGTGETTVPAGPRPA